MTEDVSEQQKRYREPQHSTYMGSKDARSHNRPLIQIDSRVEHIYHTSIDTLLAEQITNVLSQHKKDLYFLDIGSGNGGLLEGMHNPTLLPTTRQLMKQHSDFHIHAIGITDSSDGDSHNKEKPLVPYRDTLDSIESDVNSRIERKNIQYSLTATQTLEQFLTANTIPELDLVMATESLRYFSAERLKETLETVVSHMPEKGVCLAMSYTGTLRGYRGAANVEPLIRQVDWQNPSLKSILLDNIYDSRLHDRIDEILSKAETAHIPIEEEQKAYEKALKLFERTKSLTEEDKHKIESEIPFYTHGMPLTAREHLYLVANWTISEGLQNLSKKRLAIQDKKKKEIIQQIPDTETTFFMKVSEKVVLN